MNLTLKSILKSLPALPLIIISIYFGIGAFLYIGLDLFFAILVSITVVGMMEYIFQIDAQLFKAKRLFLAIGLLFIWLIFFGVSIAGNIYSIWNMMDKAKQDRTDNAIQNINEGTDTKLLDTQINLLIKKLQGYQDSYNSEDSWWVKDQKIKPNLESAQIELNNKILERKQLLESEKQKIQRNEIGITQAGDINPILKIVIAILLAIIVDIGGCIIIMFSWIFGKQDFKQQAIFPMQENTISNDETTSRIKQDVQDFASRLQKPLTWLDKVTKFYDCLVIDYNQSLYGRTSKQFLESGLSITDYNNIRSKAIDIGYLKSERKGTWFGSYWNFETDKDIRELFIKGLSNEDN